jgi:mycofactocin glycosyltransferase
VPYVPTTCLVVRRHALERSGGFDPGLRYGEDVDLVWRLVAAGGTVRYEPAITARHPPRPSIPAFVGQRRSYGSAAGSLARRHGDLVAPVRCSGWSLAVWALAASGHPWAAAVLAGWTARALRPKLDALPDPAAEAVRLAATGHWWAARSLSHHLVRTWWPLTAVAAATSRRGRRLLALGVTASVASRWPGSRRPSVAAMGLLDDLAYGTGVWQGLGRGTARAVLPGLVAWPRPRQGRWRRAQTDRGDPAVTGR